MGAERRSNYNPRTGKHTKPKKWYGNSSRSSKKSGCYVATAVYGSYDCPEVWTLRRYRDYHLSNSVFGRAFIKLYYAVSPTIVKLFGNTKWFNRLFRKRLDNVVKRLNDQGYSSDKYEDIEW